MVDATHGTTQPRTGGAVTRRARTTGRPRSGPGSALGTAIRETAWRQIAEHGAAALSLRAVARELHITAPAIYHYYPSRDDLVTALLVDAFTSFGDAQVAALAAAPPDDLAAQLCELGLAYRRWALSNPPRYQLIFGAPIPGFEPPPAQVMPAGVRALDCLAGVVARAHAAGRLLVTDVPAVTPGCEAPFELWREHGGQPDAVALTVALYVWARVHGLVSLELTGHLPSFGPDGNALYRMEMAALTRQLLGEPQ